MTLIEKSDTYLNSPSESEGGDLLLDAWRVCLAEALERKQHEWEQLIELQAARSRAIISELEAKLATLEARIQSRLGELKDGKDGDVGPQGPEGPVGPEGAKGLAGEVGERGLRGEPGEAGPRGERGSAGPTGLRGPRGEKGLRGERGEIGRAGKNGKDGQDGKEGKRGEIGLQGERGDHGEKGEKGEKGEPGEPGEPGIAGERGPTGPQGECGEKGDPGPLGQAGPVGPQGEPGLQGLPGLRGERGEFGPCGKIGPQGGIGPEGPRGEKGDPGLLPMVKAWVEDEITYAGHVVFHDGGTWQAKKDTAQKPPHRDWLPLALAGRDATGFCIRGTFNSEESYNAFDVVALNGSSFCAKVDSPGACPESGNWQLIASCGKQGKPGPIGPRGEMGERGLPAASIVGGVIEDYTLKLVKSDGGKILIPLRPAFEKYHEESN